MTRPPTFTADDIWATAVLVFMAILNLWFKIRNNFIPHAEPWQGCPLGNDTGYRDDQWRMINFTITQEACILG